MAAKTICITKTEVFTEKMVPRLFLQVEQNIGCETENSTEKMAQLSNGRMVEIGFILTATKQFI
jgi:hypothetical protein